MGEAGPSLTPFWGPLIDEQTPTHWGYLIYIYIYIHIYIYIYIYIPYILLWWREHRFRRKFEKPPSPPRARGTGTWSLQPLPSALSAPPAFLPPTSGVWTFGSPAGQTVDGCSLHWGFGGSFLHWQLMKMSAAPAPADFPNYLPGPGNTVLGRTLRQLCEYCEPKLKHKPKYSNRTSAQILTEPPLIEMHWKSLFPKTLNWNLNHTS